MSLSNKLYCAGAAVGLAAIAVSPQAEHIAGIYWRSAKFSFCNAPPAFESVYSFAQSLSLKGGSNRFAEIKNMMAVEYHSMSKAPLRVIKHEHPELFLVSGYLVDSGISPQGNYFYRLGDSQNQAVVTIETCKKNWLREWNYLPTGGKHRVVFEFIQNKDGAAEKKDAVRVTAGESIYYMNLNNAYFED